MLVSTARILLRQPKATRRPKAAGFQDWGRGGARYEKKCEYSTRKKTHQINSALLATALRRSILVPDGIAMQTCFVVKSSAMLLACSSISRTTRNLEVGASTNTITY